MAAEGETVTTDQHTFVADSEMKTQLEEAYSQGKQKARLFGTVRNIVGSNDALVKEGHYELDVVSRADGTKTVTRERHELPALPASRAICCPDFVRPLDTCTYPETRLCVANCDTITAALLLAERTGDVGALNFGNAEIPGGGYRAGCVAQEEDLCRQIPQLEPALATARYPLEPGTALVTSSLPVLRAMGTYELGHRGFMNVITAAMPCGDPAPLSDMWYKTVALRIRAVLNAAKVSGQCNLVLGAFGCGIFGNPPKHVAKIFAEQLRSPEFRGAFQHVVFAIIDPRGDGNLAPFERVLNELLE